MTDIIIPSKSRVLLAEIPARTKANGTANPFWRGRTFTPAADGITTIKVFFMPSTVGTSGAAFKPYTDAELAWDPSLRAVNDTFQAIRVADRQRVLDNVFGAWSRLAKINFVQTLDMEQAEIRIGVGTNTLDPTARPSLSTNPVRDPSDATLGSWNDVYISPARYDPANILGSIDWFSPGRVESGDLMHEVGHAIGLDHPTVAQRGVLSDDYNHLWFNVLSNRTKATDGFTASTPMLFDAVAVQRLYGLRDQGVGDTVYRLDSAGGPNSSTAGDITGKLIVDSGGIDTLVAGYVDANGSNQLFSTNCEIDLRATDFAAGKTYLSSIGTGPGKYNVAIYEGSVIENAIGGNGNDTLIGNAVANRLEGGKGSDTLMGDAGNDTYIFSGAFGSDTIRDTDGTILLDGVALPTGLKVGSLPGSYRSSNGRVSYTLAPATNGTTQNLVITVIGPSKGTVTVQGWTAGQLGITLSETPGATTPTTRNVSGTSGDDRLFAVSGTGLVAGPTTQLQSSLSRAKLALLDLLDPIDQDATTDEATLLQGQDGNDLAVGRSADDVLDGGTGDDLLLGGLGADTIRGGSGADWIFGSGSGAVGTLRDPVPVPSGSTVLTRGYGWVVYADASGTPVVGDVSADALAGDAGNLIDGGAGDDHIDAGSGDDIAHGGDDNDTVYGLAGNDTLFGDAGNDTLFGDGVVRTGTLESVAGIAHGNDVLIGGAGTDNLFGDGGDDELYGGDDNDFIYGDQSTLNRGILPQQFDGNDYLDGGAGNDWMEGGQRDDTLFGGVGDDTMFGDGAQLDEAATFEGQDYLDGEDGNDQLSGGGNDDELFGGIGNDMLWGDSAGSNATNQGKDYLDGEAGADQLIGGGNDDELFGGDGDDKLWGDEVQSTLAAALHGKDHLDGGAGNDQMVGGGNDDELYGGDGADIMVGDDYIANLAASAHGNDYMEGGAGNDSMEGDGGDDVLYGGDGNDWLAGEDQLTLTATTTLTGNDTLYGEAGNDTLLGGAGDDFLDGGVGNDYLSGGSGNDTLVIGAGNDLLIGGSGNDRFVLGADADGSARVSDTGTDGADTLVLDGVSMAFDNIWRSDNFLGIRRDDGSSAGGVFEFYRGDVIERVEFAGGVVATLAEVRQLSMTGGSGNDIVDGFATGDLMTGGAGNDLLFGRAGNDTLDGGAGNDTLDGGSGDNTFLFGIGSGQDSVTNTPGYEGGTLGTNVLRMGPGIAPSGVTVGRSGDSLVLQLAGSSESVTIVADAWGDPEVWGATSVQFDDGTVWNVDTLRRSLTQGTAGADSITGYAGEDLLDGGAGDDTLNGAGSSNVFLFGKGDGHDTVDQGYQRGYQVLRFKPGVAVGDVAYVQSGIDLIVVILSTDDQIRFVNAFGSSGGGSNPKPASPLNRIEFADGTVIASNGIDNNVPVTLAGLSALATAGDDVLDGTAGSDLVYALAGNDSVFGNAGNDALHGGDGNDHLYGGIGSDNLWGDAGIDIINGGDGNDVIFGGDGDDYLYGENGNDTLDGGKGIDVLYGDAGDNTFAFGRGDQQDRIYGAYQQAPTAVNTLRFKVGVAVADVSVTKDTFSGDAVLKIAGTTDEMRLSHFFDDFAASKPTAVQRVVFDDGTTWDVAAIVAQSLHGQTLVGTAGNDNLVGTTGDDNIQGLAGNDILNGDAGNDTVDGGSGNDQIFGGAGNNTLIGGAGDDLIYALSADDVVIENANEGTDTLFAGANWTLGATIENLTLINSALSGTGNAANNVITGNALNNVLSGANGDDTIDGGAGADAMNGGLGNDTFVVDSTGDTVIEAANEGTDLVQSSITFGLAANVENLTLTGTGAIAGTGNGLGNVLLGNSAANTLSGGAGDDTLNGGAGADTMLGGVGNDSYVVDNAADQITENLNEGTDGVSSSVTYTLAANVENLTLTGAGVINGTGNALDNGLVGNGANNTLTGGAGNDTLDGGLGNDTMLGGAGNDTYVVNIASDVVTENPNEGTDTVQSAVTWTLGTNVENLVLTGTAAINGVGNTAVNRLTGNTAANTLDGGAGADTLVGGAGNDLYVVDNAADAIVENANEGIDAANSSVTCTLAANVENLTLTGTGAINGTGNALDNVLIGNGANNTLNGGAGNDTLDGGLGNDTMLGGAGNDIYVVNVATDIVTENANEGTDTVRSAVTWTLSANLENLTLIGASAINGTGNANANVLTGNAAANTLTGAEGSDTYDGAGGNDALTDTSTNSSDTYRWGLGLGTDTITDAGGTLDHVDLFAGITKAQLKFVKNVNNLEMGVLGQTDKLIVKNWYLGAANQIEEFRLNDGSKVLASEVQGLLSAMAQFGAPQGMMATGNTTPNMRALPAWKLQELAASAL